MDHLASIPVYGKDHQFPFIATKPFYVNRICEKKKYQATPFVHCLLLIVSDPIRYKEYNYRRLSLLSGYEFGSYQCQLET